MGAVGVAGTALAGQPDPAPEKKVTICHATSSATNPYVRQTVSVKSISKDKGHDQHQDGRDVIPPFSYDDGGVMTNYPGKNWTKGQMFLANGCFPLVIDKTGPDQIVAGGTIPYSVTVTNVGLAPVPFGSISVKDRLDGTVKIPLVPPGDQSDLQPGEARVWTGSYLVKDDPESPARCGQVIKNTAKVTLDGWQKDPRVAQESQKRKTKMAKARVAEAKPRKTTRSDSMTTTVICPLDVALSKTSAEGTVTPGGTVSYTLGVTNTGPLPIPTKSIVVTDETASAPPAPPADLPDFLAPSATANWTASKSVALDAVLCGSSVQNTASVALDFTKGEWPKYSFTPGADDTAVAAGVLVTGGICTTPTPDTPLTPASVPGVVAFRPASAPALSVEKTGTARVLAGGNLLYTITVTNTGTEAATGVVLNETPPGTMLWRAVPAGATRSGRNVSWNIGTLEGGQSVTKSIRLKMRRTATGRSCNVASATSTNAGSARDRACTTVSVARRPATPVTG